MMVPAIEALPKGVLIGGAWRPSSDSATFEVDNPATGEVLCRVADATPDDSAAALRTAAAAQPSWGRSAPRQRARILRTASERLIADEERLALIMTLEMGKPLADARGEVRYAAEFFRWFSEEAVRIHGTHAVQPDGRGQILTVREPVGPSLLITPWNFPLAMGARKIGPAIAAGCTIVFKPAPQTPLSSLALAQIRLEAGLPPEVLSVLPTSRAAAVVEPMLRSGVIRKLSFTGSTQTGRILLAQAASAVVRTSMELGGNAPFIVFDDADMDVAVDAAMNAKMRNMGEACTAANRIYVHRSIVETFTARLSARISELRVGDGTAEGSQVGPLIDRGAVGKVQRLVDDAVARGAKLRTGGSVVEGTGFFYRPTVLTDIPADAGILDEEIFGPVAPVIPFDDEESMIAAANATEWGLVGYVITTDLDRAQRVASALEVGMVGLNTGVVSDAAAPFGGVKQSGLGREGGHLGIDEFLNHKYIAIAAPKGVAR